MGDKRALTSPEIVSLEKQLALLSDFGTVEDFGGGDVAAQPMLGKRLGVGAGRSEDAGESRVGE